MVSDDGTKSTKDIMKGFGIGYVPAEASSPAANADRVRRERKMALEKWMSFHKELCPLDEILGFDKISKKVEGNQLYDESTNISEKVNKMMDSIRWKDLSIFLCLPGGTHFLCRHFNQLF